MKTSSSSSFPWRHWFWCCWGSFETAAPDGAEREPVETTDLKINMLTKMLAQQGKASREHRAALLGLFLALRDSAPKLSPDAMQAFGKAREVLARYED